ncbi:MAG: PepSY-like domain-containing protein [Prevotella sp.]|jgi:hypothetical protein|nr:PepSY-like domain-containing protein [Prevotella sp.]MBR3080945.1 PepSY-like domain-containing protein [Prevotella sp.]
MRQTRFFLIMILALMVSALSFAESNPIPAERLPVAAKSFIKKSFAKAKVVNATRDHDGYACRLDNGIDLEFNAKGTWTKMDGSVRTVLPDSVVHPSICKYVKTKYPKSGITQIEKGRYGYKVELSSKYNLKFTYQGKFIGKNH